MFCKYHQLHYFIKCQQKTPAGQTLYGALLLDMYGGGTIYLDSDMDKSGRSDHFPEGRECTKWFFIMSAGTKSKFALKLSSPNSNTKTTNLKYKLKTN